MNRSVFYMCSKCGYTEIGNKSVFPKIIKIHKQSNLYQCDNEELYRVYLGHSFKTDVIKMNIPLLDMHDKNSMGKALSFLYALLDGASIELNIDRDDIDGIVEPNTITKTLDIILFDNIPGGAGFVKRLTDGVIFKNCLIAALNKISVHCCDEDTSCYNCLRNFNNQRYHNLLKRKLAIEILKEVIKIINP